LSYMGTLFFLLSLFHKGLYCNFNLVICLNYALYQKKSNYQRTFFTC